MVKALNCRNESEYYMNDIYNIVSDIDIPAGHTKRMNCPVCKGVKTFTVTNNMGSLVWNCYKASCGTKGGTRVHMTVADIKRGFGDAEKFAEEKFTLPEYVVPYTSDVAEWAWELYGLDATELDMMYDVKEHRAVFPVVHSGIMVDATGRSLGNRLPKWKRYGKSSLPYVYGYGKVAVVVEDCVSAAVVGSDVWCGVAVLGTSLSESHKRYLSQFSTAIIALDPDALPKTLAMAKELRGYVDNVRVLRLTDDLKYRNPTDFNNLTNIGV
jgi:hypothetical protein|tara:strand:- start:4215 stop:5021 length:807 start_codon:yes stop_codon:yes gene_type:complete